MSWTSEQKKLFAQSFVLTAKNYDKEIGFDLAKMITDDMSDLDFEACMKALVTYRRDPKNKFWPKASDIRQIVDPQLDAKDAARNTASRIVQAVTKFGYMQSQSAKEFIGSAGWAAVKRWGGWQ